MLKKHPDERFQTYGHMIRMLDDALAGRDKPSMTMDVVDEDKIEAAKAEGRSDFKRIALVGAVVLALIGGALGFHYTKLAQEENADRELALSEKEMMNGVNELRRDGFRTETVPMLHDISKFMEEHDKEPENFESRRERMNR